MPQPNVLFIMTDQQRFDTIASLGNRHTYTPNLDRLVRRGATFSNAYTPCPVCVAARYTIHTGCLPPTTRCFANSIAAPARGHAGTVTGRCGPYLAQTMRSLGYRTFGIGKFHTLPENEDLGFDVHLHSEELYDSPEMRRWDDYARYIDSNPAYSFIENLMGERTEMYYMPQMSPMPAEFTVEHWAADRAKEQIEADDPRPWFGFVSFVGPHPPLAPPIPFNRMYNPDRMPNPIHGDKRVDHMDEQIPWMNHAVWAEDINDSLARVLKARYYGEISYIDQCIGRILDVVDARGDANNTLICFFSDHGDHMGDHHAWQKESFFEASCHIPFLLSWPAQIRHNTKCIELVGLQDLFGIATGAAGSAKLREGVDVLEIFSGKAEGRERYIGYYGIPGTPRFKIMVRQSDWKYIYMANGAREQLFNLKTDPNELKNRAGSHKRIRSELRRAAIDACTLNGVREALKGDELRGFKFTARPLRRIHQFDRSRGIESFPKNPQDVLATRQAPRRTRSKPSRVNGESLVQEPAY